MIGHCCFGMHDIDHALEVQVFYAKKEANEKKVSMAIYKESGEYKRCESTFALENGYAIARMVLFDN